MAENEAPEILTPGTTVLGGKYVVKEHLAFPDPEADLYLCAWGALYRVIRVWRRPVRFREEELRRRKNSVSPYVAVISGTGEVNGRPAILLPWFPLGSLKGKVCTLGQIREEILPCLGEGLHAMHQAGMIHGDVRPDCVMRRSSAGGVVLADYTLRGVLDPPSDCTMPGDWYDLGLTLLELLTGQSPKRTGAFLLPGNLPSDFRTLLLGLTGPERDPAGVCRWGWEQVRAWLNGRLPPVPRSGPEAKADPFFLFQRKPYTDLTKLARAMVADWEEGKKALFSGRLSAWCEAQHPERLEVCREAEQLARKQPDQKDFLFWRVMTDLSGADRTFFWKGESWPDLAAFGAELGRDLEAGREDRLPFVAEICREGLLSAWTRRQTQKNEERLETLRVLEASWQNADRNPRQERVLFWKTGCLLSGNMVFRTGDRTFHSPEELSAALQEILKAAGPVGLSDFCVSLLDGPASMTPPLEGWLLALGRAEALETWKSAMAAPRRRAARRKA